MDNLILLTGGSGFVGSATLARLLTENHRSLRATVRNGDEHSNCISSLKHVGVTDEQLKHLQFFFVDLLNDEGWKEAMNGVKFVLHIASPIALMEKNKIQVAVEGTLRVLKFARDGGVKRIVITSSFLTVGGSSTIPVGRLFNESDFTPLENAKTLGDYQKSKIMAENAARDFVEKEGGGMELVTIHPGLIFGPVQDVCHVPGIQSILDLLRGKIPMFTEEDGQQDVVDVRDVADLHVRAVFAPATDVAGHRLLCVCDEPLDWMQISNMLHEKLPVEYAKNVKLVTKACTEVRHGDNSLPKKLGWKPRAALESILDTANSLIVLGLVEK